VYGLGRSEEAAGIRKRGINKSMIIEQPIKMNASILDFESADLLSQFTLKTLHRNKRAKDDDAINEVIIESFKSRGLHLSVSKCDEYVTFSRFMYQRFWPRLCKELNIDPYADYEDSIWNSIVNDKT